MMRIKFDKKSVNPYDHLDPLVDFLINKGNALARDYRWGQNRTGYFCLLVKPIDFASIEDEFLIPPYIVLNKKFGWIECNKSWATIMGDASKNKNTEHALS